MRIITFIQMAALIVITGLPGFVVAQEPVDEQQTLAITVPVNADQPPQDALGRGTPRGAAKGFLTASAEFNFEKASQYLDTRNLPEPAEGTSGAELARKLSHVLSRTVWIDDYNVSDQPEGLKGDGLPSFRDELVVVKTREGDEYPIWLQRVPREDGEMIWKISNRSVALIPELYDEFSYPPLVEKVRGWFPEDASFLGLEAFKWFILIVVSLAAWPVLWILGWGVSRLFSSPESPTYPLIRKAFTGPVVLLAILAIVGILLAELGASAAAQQVMDARTVTIIALVWAAWVFINLFKVHKQQRLLARDRPGAAKLMQPISTLLKLLVLMFALLFWLHNVGFNITTVLAGLGVGGLAVALALQKPIEDMMGALSIFSQAPFRVGDFCRYGDVFGFVEDIGLRTTRIRTLEHTVVSVPNGRIAYQVIENISYREKIRYKPTLRLRYDTSLEQVARIRDDIEQILANHERVHDEPVRVRFTDFEQDAILVKVHSFLKTTEYPEALAIGEELNMAIMSIVENAGARFALPGRALQVEGGEHLAHL